MAAGRPKVALISRRAALQAALDIVDAEGLDALSIRRIAERLGVNGASLYYHFKNKDEIVAGAARLALEDIRVPLDGNDPWRVWVVRNARSVRTVLCNHPHLVPVLLRRARLGIGVAELDAAALALVQAGVPAGAAVPILEALELHAIGSALHDGGTYGMCTSRRISPDEVFDVVCDQIIDVLLDVAAEREGADA